MEELQHEKAADRRGLKCLKQHRLLFSSCILTLPLAPVQAAASFSLSLLVDTLYLYLSVVVVNVILVFIVLGPKGKHKTD